MMAPEGPKNKSKQIDIKDIHSITDKCKKLRLLEHAVQINNRGFRGVTVFGTTERQHLLRSQFCEATLRTTV